MSERLTDAELDEAAASARTAQEYLQLSEMYPAWVLSMVDEITDLRAALDQERAKFAALREYVEHWDLCANTEDWAMDCTCGLKALLSGRGKGGA